MEYKRSMIGGLSALLVAGAMAGCKPAYDAKANSGNANEPTLSQRMNLPDEYRAVIPPLQRNASNSANTDNNQPLEKKVELTPEEKKKLDTIGLYDRLLEGKPAFEKLEDKDKLRLLLIANLVDDQKKVVEICYDKDKFLKNYNSLRPEQRKLADSFLIEIGKEKYDTDNLADRMFMYTFATAGSNKEEIDRKIKEILELISKDFDISPIANVYLGFLNGFQKAVGK